MSCQPVPPVMDFTSSTFAAENRPFCPCAALSSFLPALLILPLLPRSLSSFFTERFISLFAFAVLLLLCGDFSPYILSSHFSLQFSVPFSRLQSWMTHVYDPYKGTHLFSARPTLSVSLLLVFSLLCSTCLHTSAANLPQTVFCPFNILHRWRGHS